jgi:uncharacterized protein (TIGR02145 family)
VTADSVLLSGNIPENGTGTWTILYGTKGHFTNPHSPTSWFIKDSANLEFTLRWTITGKCGSSSDDVEVAFFPLSKNPCPNTPIVMDADGNVYPTIQIGTQCWMAKNLNVGQYRASTERLFDHGDVSNDHIIEKYCLFNKTDSCKLYGGLYDWDEAMGYTDMESAQGICPDGWHIPSNADWNILNANFPDNDGGTHLKIGGSSGFEALYAGNRNTLGSFQSNGSATFFWASTSWTYEGNNEGYLRRVEACNDWISRDDLHKQTGLSIRCVKNNQ